MKEVNNTCTECLPCSQCGTVDKKTLTDEVKKSIVQLLQNVNIVMNYKRPVSELVMMLFHI